MGAEANSIATEVIRQFNAVRSDIQIGSIESGSPNDLRQRLYDGERPDLLIMGLEALINFADGDIITPAQSCIDVDPTFDASDLVPISAAAYQLDRRQIGMPLAVSVPVLYYNRERFTAAGLDPDSPPSNLDEMETAIRTLRESGAVVDGLAYADASWFITQWAAQSGIMLASGANGHDDREAQRLEIDLSNPDLLALLERLQRMGKEGVISTPPPPNQNNPAMDLARLIDTSAPAAMTLHTSGSMNTVLRSYGSRVGIAPMPGPGSGVLAGGSGIWITTDDPAKVWATWQVVRTFTDVPAQVAFAEEGYAPVRQSAVDDPALQQLWAAEPALSLPYTELITIVPTNEWLGVVAGRREHIDFRFNWLAEDVIRGDDITDAVARAQVDIDRMLATYDELRYRRP